MFLNALLTPGRVEDLVAYRNGVLAAHEELGLSPDNSLAIGTAGMAALYLDGRGAGEFGPEHKSDADLVVANQVLWRVLASHPDAQPLNDHNLSVPAGRNQSRPNVTLLGGKLPKELRENLGAGSYQELSKAKIVVDGIATLTPAHLAWAKLNAGRRKDAAGILFAHALATNTGNKVVQDYQWLTQVERAATMLLAGKFKDRTFSRTPPPLWLTEQINTRFSHPAFADLGLNGRRAA